MGDFDAAFLEAAFHPAIEFALHRPASVGGAADLPDDLCHRSVDLVDAPQFQITADQRPILGLSAHLGDDVLEDLADAIGILLVGNVDADSGVAHAATGIGDAGDGAERHDMYRA